MRRKLPQGRVRQWLPIKEYTKTGVEKVGSNSISESLEIERERDRARAMSLSSDFFGGKMERPQNSF